jgi:hypothetical protein
MAMVLFCLFSGVVLGLATREVREFVRWVRLNNVSATASRGNPKRLA